MNRSSRTFRLLTRALQGGGRSLLAFALAITSFRSAIADWNDVPSGSMKPTILEGDRIFVNKLAYDLKVPFTEVRLAAWGAPKRGDIVVFFSPVDGVRLVKRVIGLPGDRLAMSGNQLYINGVAVAHDAAATPGSGDYLAENPAGPALFVEQLGTHPHQVAVRDWAYARREFAELVVPPDHYFMMGDNRDDSADSRWFGFVDRRLIAGQAVGVALSLNTREGGHYRPRWQRFLSRLP